MSTRRAKSQSLRHGADEAGQPLPRREHMQGRRAEGTVVEETDARVERPQAAQGVAEGGVGWGEEGGGH